MRTSARTALLTCAVLLQIGAQGCTQDESDTPTAGLQAVSERGTDSDDTEMSPGSPAASPRASGNLAVAWCRARERDVVHRTEYPTQRAIDDLMSSPSGVSAGAADRFRTQAERVRDAVRERCQHPSAAMATYLRVTRQRSTGMLSHRDLDAVLAAYGAWGQSVGVGDVAERLRTTLHSCRALQRKVHISHRVWWRWSDGARVWWIELAFRNDLPRGLFATLSGGVRVSDLKERAWFPAGRPRRHGVLRWGGSSADYATIRPGISRHLVALGDGAYTATGPNGLFDVEQVEVSVDVPRRQWWCSLPVPERS